MNKYELAIVINGTVDTEVRDATLEKIKGYVDRFGGTISEVDDWGKRRLAYEIEKIKDVSITKSIGGRNRVLKVTLDKDKMAENGVDALGIMQMIQVNNQQSQSGSFIKNDTEYLVTTGKFLTSAEDVENLVIGVHKNLPVYLKQVAAIQDGPSTAKSYVSFGYGQTNKKYIDTGSVVNQFDYLIDKSYKYKNYKNVNINWLYKLKSNVADSLTDSKKEILSSYNTINFQKNTIDSLKMTINNSDNTITNLNSEKQSISFLGIQFNKGFFKTLVLTIIVALTVFLLFFITKFKRSNSITSQTKLALKELEEEYDMHRKRALEREQKVMRKLQDELNKQKKE